MRLRAVLLGFLQAVLAGCGGGYVAVFGSDTGFEDVSFVVWSGSASGDHVVDVNNHAFAFYSDNGCLYNFQTERENPAFCLAPESATVFFGGVQISIINVRSVTGTCIAAMLETSTGNFVAVDLDPYGREVIAVTQLHPIACVA